MEGGRTSLEKPPSTTSGPIVRRPCGGRGRLTPWPWQCHCGTTAQFNPLFPLCTRLGPSESPGPDHMPAVNLSEGARADPPPREPSWLRVLGDSGGMCGAVKMLCSLPRNWRNRLWYGNALSEEGGCGVQLDGRDQDRQSQGWFNGLVAGPRLPWTS